MPAPAERRRPRVRLTVSTLGSEPGQPGWSGAPNSWLIAGALAGVTAALAGWLVLTGLALVVWFTAMAMPLTTVLTFGSQAWLAGNGAGAVVGGHPVTLIPLGLTALLVAIVRVVVGLAIRPMMPESGRLRSVFRLGGVAALTYTATAVVIAALTGPQERVGFALLGAFLTSAAGALWAVAPQLGAGWRSWLPGWTVGMPRAIGAGLLALVATSAGTLLIALVLGSARIAMIEGTLGPDPIGEVMIVVTELLYLPNLLVWVTSFTLGAGFTFGTGSVVAPMVTQLGLLPAIPVLGALPPSGPGGPWSLSWLLTGLIAGIATGWVAASRPRYHQPIGRTLARGTGAGFALGLAVTLAGLLSGGSLGVDHLVGMGPVMLNLSWIAPTSLLLWGACGAALNYLVVGRHRPPGPDDTPTTLIPDEETTVLSGR